MTIKAKFKCSSVKKLEGGTEEVTLTPINGPVGSDNAQWSKYTPSGSINMSITAEGAVGCFEPGKVYFVDFTPE